MFYANKSKKGIIVIKLKNKGKMVFSLIIRENSGE